MPANFREPKGARFVGVHERSGLLHDLESSTMSRVARIFQLSLRGSADAAERRHETKRTTVAVRRETPLLVASGESEGDALRLQQPVKVFSVILSPGRHLVHALDDGHGAWLHVVDGKGGLHGATLASGDGAGVTQMPSVSFTAVEETELLLIELGFDDAPVDG